MSLIQIPAVKRMRACLITAPATTGISSTATESSSYRKCSTSIQSYKMAMQRVAAGDEVTVLQIKMTTNDSHLDDRRYNRPTASEVAAILPGTGEEQTSGKRDIIA
jgi:hypothetical protein